MTLAANRFAIEIEDSIARRDRFFAIALPPLVGTPKQVAWAESIRRDAVAIAYRQGIPPAGWIAFVGRCVSASWWIDNRNQPPERDQLITAIRSAIAWEF